MGTGLEKEVRSDDMLYIYIYFICFSGCNDCM